jgi:phage shock protein C
MSSKGNLHRVREGKILAGVCAGLGEHFDKDPVIFRVLFVLFAFFDGIGILAYLILWLVLPLYPQEGKVREINSK